MGVYARLRAQHGEVAPVLLTGDIPAWLVLGYREILEVVRTPTRFSRDSRRWRELREGRVPQDSPLLPVIGWRPDCVSADGDEHRRLREAVIDSLGRFDRRGIRRHVTRFANQIIDGFCEDGRADLLTQYAQQLPMIVLTELLGMPEEYGPRIVEAALELIKGSEKAVEGNEYIRSTLRQLVARRHEEPGADLASWLMEHRAGLSDDEVLNHLWLVMLAANENTTSLIANTVRMVLTDHRFRASLAGVRMTLEDAVEQVLWDEPPTVVLPARWATGDSELAGRHIRSGDMLLLGLAAGNVDPLIRPDLGASMHGNRAHLSFSGGPHECPGQDVARAITDTAVDILLTRLPDVELAVPESELAWRSSTWTRHLAALPVKFGPRSPMPVPEQAPPVRSPRSMRASMPQMPPLVTATAVPGSPGGPPAGPAGMPSPRPSRPPSRRRPWWKAVARWFSDEPGSGD
nr:cytochrome P450 [Wenjunlia tyrosinilytica]